MANSLDSAEDWLDSQEFHELCMDYRHAEQHGIFAPGLGLPTAADAYAKLQAAIRRNCAAISNAASQ